MKITELLQINEMKNEFGEVIYSSFGTWKRAAKTANPDVWFDGDADICNAMVGPKPYKRLQTRAIGEWDGEQGVVFKSAVNEQQDVVHFYVDSERAYDAIIKKFGYTIDQDEDSGLMTAPRKHWAAIEQLAHDAGGGAEEEDYGLGSPEHYSVREQKAGAKFKSGDEVTVKNAKKYDSMATAGDVSGVVDFVWPDGRVAVKVKVGASTGQMNVDASDLVQEGVVSNYAEQLARQIFDLDPNLDTSGRADELMKVSYSVAKKELGARAEGFFRDEDFPSDFVSAYHELQKQGMAEGHDEDDEDDEKNPFDELEYGKEYPKDKIQSMIDHGYAEVQSGDINNPRHAIQLLKLGTRETKMIYVKEGAIGVNAVTNVAEGSGLNVVKSVKVGNFRHDLVDLGFGWQVRIYNGDELYHTGLNKNSEQKGLAALDDAVSYTKKQLNIKEQGVTEGPMSADEYKQKLLDTLPQMMDFYEKNVKGWKPSKEQMLAAIETGYIVMKRTGDAQQAGKAVKDELDTLHRMSQGKKQGMAEGHVLDSRGKPIKAGDTLIWKDAYGTHTGIVTPDPKYTGGLKIGGRSVKNIIDDSDSVKIIEEGHDEDDEYGAAAFAKWKKQKQYDAEYELNVGDVVTIKSSGKKGKITAIKHGMVTVQLPGQTALHPQTAGSTMVHEPSELIKEGTGEAVAEGSVYATDSEMLASKPDLPVTIHKSPYEGAEVGEYTEMFHASPKTAQQFAKYIILKGGMARIGKRGQDMYVYHKGAGPISKRDFRMSKIEEGTGDPEEGWCLVMANGKVTGNIRSDIQDAKEQQKRAPVATVIKWGKRASDGSNEYVATRAVSPAREIKEQGVAEAASTAARFKEKVDQAANAAASGRHEAAKRHLDAARSFMLGVPSTDMQKIQDSYETYKNLRKRYSGAGGDYDIKDDMVGTAKVVKEAAQKLRYHVVSKLDGYVLASYATREEAMKAAHGNPVVSGELETVGDHKFVKEAFSEDDLAVGGTIIYKADEQYRMSDLAAKLVGRKLKLMNGAVIDLSDVVSTDESDWSRFRDMRVVSGIKYPTEKIAEAGTTVPYKQQFTKWGVVPKSAKKFVTFFKPDEQQKAQDFAEKTHGKLIKVDQAGRQIKEAAYDLGLDPDKRIVVRGVRGMKSTPFTKKFKNLAAYEAWLDSDDAGDYQIFAVMNESVERRGLFDSTFASHHEEAMHHLSHANDANSKGDDEMYHAHMMNYHESMADHATDKGDAASAEYHRERAAHHDDKISAHYPFEQDDTPEPSAAVTEVKKELQLPILVSVAGNSTLMCDGSNFILRSGGKRLAKMPMTSWQHILDAVKNRTSATTDEGYSVSPKGDSYTISDSSGTVLVELTASDMDKLAEDSEKHFDAMNASQHL